MDEHASGTGEFTIIRGGPVYRQFVRFGLAATDPVSAWRAVLVYALVGWVPLFIFNFAQRAGVGDAPRFTLYQDLLVYARYLVIVVTLLFTTCYTNPSLAMAVQHFQRTGLIRQADDPRYAAILAQAKRRRDSVVADIVIILLAYLGAYIGLRTELHHQTSTWITVDHGLPGRLTLAGWWYVVVTIPLYQILLYRWLWRLCIWYRFLWDVSRLPLQLQPIHPDMLGGLGFILIGHVGFGFLIFAISAITAANVGNRFLFQHIPFSTYTTLFVSLAFILLLIFLLPLFIFSPLMLRAKRQGLLEYGLLAAHYVCAFTERWERGDQPPPDRLLGSPDFQSLADLANGFNIVRKMRVMLFDANMLLVFVAMALLPIIPLSFTVRTLHEIVAIIFKLLMP